MEEQCKSNVRYAGTKTWRIKEIHLPTHTHTHTNTHTHDPHITSTWTVLVLGKLTLKCNARSIPHSQQVPPLTYIWHQVTIGPHVLQSRLALKQWYNVSQQFRPPQTYIKANSQNQLPQAGHNRKSLLYFSELHILFSHFTLHEEATLVRNMLQPTNTMTARTMSAHYSTD